MGIHVLQVYGLAKFYYLDIGLVNVLAFLIVHTFLIWLIHDWGLMQNILFGLLIAASS